MWKSTAAITTLATAAALLGGGCERAGGIAAGRVTLAGGHALLSRNGVPLPVDLGEFRWPPPPAPPAGAARPSADCRTVLSEGWLGLDWARQRFTLQQVTRMTSGNLLLSLRAQIGTFSRAGDTLSFSSERHASFRGVMRNSRIVVLLDGDTLVFDAAAVDVRDPAGSTLRLASVDGKQVPAPHDNLGGGCTGNYVDGTLQFSAGPLVRYDMGVATGSFAIQYRVVSSCTGETVRVDHENGFYEAAGSGMYLEGQIAPGIVHPFWAILRPAGADLFYFSEMAFQP